MQGPSARMSQCTGPTAPGVLMPGHPIKTNWKDFVQLCVVPVCPPRPLQLPMSMPCPHGPEPASLLMPVMSPKVPAHSVRVGRPQACPCPQHLPHQPVGLGYLGNSQARDSLPSVPRALPATQLCHLLGKGPEPLCLLMELLQKLA